MVPATKQGDWPYLIGGLSMGCLKVKEEEEEEEQEGSWYEW